MKTLGVALAGLGQAARNIHLPALAKLSDRFVLKAAFDPDEGARRAFAEKRPEVSVVDSYEALLEEEAEVVSIVSPPAFHERQTVDALEAGRHAFCEKPMAGDLGEADRMLEAARKTGRRLLINGEFPDMRIHRAARAQLCSEEFGRLLLLRITQSFRATEETEAGWRAEARRRVCFDFGVHVFDLACWLFGEAPARLDCRMPDPVQADKESVNLITLEWEDGRAASIVLNRLARGPHRYLDMELTGERGEITTSLGGEARVEVGIRKGPPRPYLTAAWAPGGRCVLRNGDRSRTLATESFEPFADAAAERLKALHDWVCEGREPERGAEHHRMLLALTLAAYQSAESGRAIDVTGLRAG